MPKKEVKPKQNLQNECLVFTLRNIGSNEFLLIIFHISKYMKIFIGANYQ
jgi:hypothetical protein